jgi:hypothetical protein
MSIEAHGSSQAMHRTGRILSGIVITALRWFDREAHVKTCPDCNGDGVIEKGTDDEQQCPTCGGSGFVPDDDDDEEVIRTATQSDNVALCFPREVRNAANWTGSRRNEIASAT